MLLQHQFTEFQAEKARQRSRAPHRVNIPLFATLIGKVSHYALNKLYEELETSRKPGFIIECKDDFRQVMGLPCAHFIQQQLTTGQNIHPAHVHRHWFFEPLAAPTNVDLILDPQLLDPLPVQTRGRPRGARSTRRQPSQFEIVTRSRQLERQQQRT